MELTKGKGAEAVLDFVAERGTTAKGLAMTRRMGSYYVVGYGEDINVSAFEMITTEKNIIGNLVGTWAELTELMSLADKGHVHLAAQEYSLADANLALQDLNNGKVKDGLSLFLNKLSKTTNWEEDKMKKVIRYGLLSGATALTWQALCMPINGAISFHISKTPAIFRVSVHMTQCRKKTTAAKSLPSTPTPCL